MFKYKSQIHLGLYLATVHTAVLSQNEGKATEKVSRERMVRKWFGKSQCPVCVDIPDEGGAATKIYKHPLFYAKPGNLRI